MHYNVPNMIVKHKQDEIIGYLEDSSNLRGGKAEILFIPESEEDILKAVKECADKKMPLTISGGGTGTVGARIPFSGAAISMERLKKIISIDKDNMSAKVQAGVMIKDFLVALENEDLFYPPFPTERNAFIAGNISTNASGEYSYCFGSTRDYVLGLKVILSTGKILEIKRGEYVAGPDGNISTPAFKLKIPSYESPNVKSSAGYFSHPGMDLIDLFIGSEGTLGIITQAEVKIIKKLPKRFIMILFFGNEDNVPEFLKKIKKDKLATPLSLEYFDRESLFFLKKDFPNIPECECAVYIEDEEKEENFEIWANLISEYNIIDTWMSKDEKSYQNFVSFRYKLPENVNEYFKKIGSIKLAIDASVPEQAFNDFFLLYKKTQKEIGIRTVRFGHIGENHLHFNFFPKDDIEKEKVEEIYEGIIRKAAAAGGSISAEHGIGKLKHKYLKMMYGEKGINEMVRIKKEIDPYCIFGVDNIFDKELLK